MTTIGRFLTHNDPEVRNFAKFLIDLIDNQGFVLERESVTDSFMFWFSKPNIKKDLFTKLRFEYHNNVPSVVVALYRAGLYIGGNCLTFSFVEELEKMFNEVSWFGLIT